MQSKIITYEHPLNEIVRACLKIEQLLQQVHHQINDCTMLGAHHAIRLIIEMLQLLERPDLKAKLSKELNQCLNTLAQYSQSPQADTEKLETLTQKLAALSHQLIDSNEKIGHRLRDIELLNNLRLQLNTPGGGCGFDMPVYHYWLQQPQETRQATLQDWVQSFTAIQAGVTLLLEIIRNHSKTEDKSAANGFYQEMLDPQTPLRLIRINVPTHIPAFPQISVGRHFLSVRFFSPNIVNQPVQYTNELAFSLAYCY